MNAYLYKNRNLITFGVPLFLILSVIVLANSSVFQLHPKELSIAITFDLIFIILAIYFLLIRKKEIPKVTTVPFFIVGIVIASIIIPKDFQFYLTQVKNWILPIVETIIFFIVIYKVRQLNKAFRKDNLQSLDFYSALKNASAQILPKRISTAFATEIAVIFYGFLHWRKRKLSVNEFSYHKSSGTIALLLVFIFLIMIETSVVHMLLQKWSVVSAWILTILSIYTCIQVFEIMRSMSKRPISIDNGELKLRYGLFSETTILISNINTIELSTVSVESDETIKKLPPLREFESHNVVIRLKEEEVLFGLYGLTSKYKNLALYVDEKEQFKKEIENIIQQW